MLKFETDPIEFEYSWTQFWKDLVIGYTKGLILHSAATIAALAVLGGIGIVHEKWTNRKK